MNDGGLFDSGPSAEALAAEKTRAEEDAKEAARAAQLEKEKDKEKEKEKPAVSVSSKPVTATAPAPTSPFGKKSIFDDDEDPAFSAFAAKSPKASTQPSAAAPAKKAVFEDLFADDDLFAAPKAKPAKASGGSLFDDD